MHYQPELVELLFLHVLEPCIFPSLPFHHHKHALERDYTIQSQIHFHQMAGYKHQP